MIKMHIAGLGIITLSLDYQAAPNTAANFVDLCCQGFYDGLAFHRIIKGFMIQGGDPKGNGTGGPGFTIEGEFSQNGFPNTLSHYRGVISMARAMNPNSAGSQFFIMHKDAPHLDGSYAAFGHVADGFEIVEQIANVRTDSADRPLERVIISKVEVIDEPQKAVKRMK